MNTIVTLIQQFFRAFIWWVMVAPWEQAIRVRAGRWVRKLGPGPHWKIPILDRVYVQSVRRRVTDMPVQTLTSKDGKTFTLAGALGYWIEDLLLLYETLHHAEGTIRNLVMGRIADYIVGKDSAELSPGQLQIDVANGLDLQRFGLRDPQILITTFAQIRAHRLIMDSLWGSGGDLLNTNQATGASPTP